MAWLGAGGCDPADDTDGAGGCSGAGGKGGGAGTTASRKSAVGGSRAGRASADECGVTHTTRGVPVGTNPASGTPVSGFVNSRSTRIQPSGASTGVSPVQPGRYTNPGHTESNVITNRRTCGQEGELPLRFHVAQQAWWQTTLRTQHQMPCLPATLSISPVRTVSSPSSSALKSNATLYTVDWFDAIVTRPVHAGSTRPVCHSTNANCCTGTIHLRPSL